MEIENSLITATNKEVVEASGVNNILTQIRPQWQAKKLIQRVNRLIYVDPSSACQRILNASIHDLKEKIIIAGIDIAEEAAKQHKLPPVKTDEDVENYSVYTTISLAYRMGLLSRPEYKRLSRAYDIRRDLEHEDDEYEAGVEDTIYIFKTCIDVILSKDPIHLLKITDIKDIVEESTPTTLSQDIIDDYEHAPQPRQYEIYKFLLSMALNTEQPDIVRENSYTALFTIKDLTQKKVILDSAKDMITKIGRKPLQLLEARVAYASGIFPYLKKSQIKDFFLAYYNLLDKTGYHWSNHTSHGEVLRNFKEIGGLEFCPSETLSDIVEWLTLCYIGVSGGYGDYGRNRKVFYSNSGAPLSFDILVNSPKDIKDTLEKLKIKSEPIKLLTADKHIDRRFQKILDNIEQ